MVVHSTRGTATDAGNDNARFRLSFLGFTERFDLLKIAKAILPQALHRDGALRGSGWSAPVR